MRERLRRNLTGKSLGELGARVASLAFNLVLARGLGSADFGRYSYAYAFAGLIALCGEIGLNTLLTREAARDREKAGAYLRLFEPLRVLTVVLVALFTVALSLVATERSRLPEIALMSVLMAANTLLDYHTAVFTAFERMGHDAGMRIATRTTISILGIAAVLLGLPLLGVLLAITAGNLVSVGIGWAWRWKVGLTFGTAWDGAFARRALVTAFPMAAATIGTALYLYMDNLILAAVGFGDAEIGQYGAAAKVLDASQALPLIVVGGIFPVVAQLSHAGNPAAIAPFFTRVSRLGLVLGAPLAGIGAVLAPAFAALLFGPDFAATGPCLAWLALAAPAFYSNVVAIYLLLAMGLRWEAASFRAASSVLKAALIFALWRPLGILSAAVAMLVADLALFVALMIWRRGRELSEAGERRLVLKVAAGSVVAFVSWHQARGLHYLAQAAAIALAFLAAYAVLGLLRPAAASGRPEGGAA